MSLRTRPVSATRGYRMRFCSAPVAFVAAARASDRTRPVSTRASAGAAETTARGALAQSEFSPFLGPRLPPILAVDGDSAFLMIQLRRSSTADPVGIQVILQVVDLIDREGTSLPVTTTLSETNVQ